MYIFFNYFLYSYETTFLEAGLKAVRKSIYLAQLLLEKCIGANYLRDGGRGDGSQWYITEEKDSAE